MASPTYLPGTEIERCAPYEPEGDECERCKGSGEVWSDPAQLYTVPCGCDDGRGDRWVCCECGRELGVGDEAEGFVRYTDGSRGHVCSDCVERYAEGE